MPSKGSIATQMSRQARMMQVTPCTISAHPQDLTFQHPPAAGRRPPGPTTSFLSHLGRERRIQTQGLEDRHLCRWCPQSQDLSLAQDWEFFPFLILSFQGLTVKIPRVWDDKTSPGCWRGACPRAHECTPVLLFARLKLPKSAHCCPSQPPQPSAFH